MAEYTLVRIKTATRAKLSDLAKHHKRSMANMLEVLIDDAHARLPKQP